MSTQPPIRPTTRAKAKRRAANRRRNRMLMRQFFSIFFIGIFVLGTVAFVIPQVVSQTQATQTPEPPSSSPVALTQVLPTGTADASGQLVQKADEAAAAGDWTSAVGFYKAALGLATGNATLEFKLGKAYGSMGDYANAVDHIQKALDLNPQATFATEAQGLLADYKSKVSATPGGGLVTNGTVTTTGTITATEPMTK